MSIELPAFVYAHNLSKKYAILLVGIKVLKTQPIFQRGSVSMRKGGIQRYISLHSNLNEGTIGLICSISQPYTPLRATSE